MSTRPTLAATGAILLAGLGLAACSSGSHAAVATTTTTTYVAPPQLTTPTVVIGGATVSVPQDAAGKPILPLRDNGHNIILTTKGLLPQDLEACTSVPVVFTNLTRHTVRLWNDDLPPVFSSQELAPGASFTYTPPAKVAFSFTYHTSLGFLGAVEIGQVPGAC